MPGWTEILVSGFGGQGVVRIGQILSTAAVYQGLNATMLISHGTETRGGYVRSQLVISDEPIDSPVVERPDFFCALSKAAYNRFKSMVTGGLIIYDPALVEPDLTLNVRQMPFKARDIAVNELGHEIFANVVLLGGLIKIMGGMLAKEHVLKAMLERIPRFHEENKRALELGYRAVEGIPKKHDHT